MNSSFLPSFTWAFLNTRMNLSPREADIIRYLSADEPEASIAHRLGISPHTVHSHVGRLYRKLGVSSRTQVVQRLFAEYVAKMPPSRTAFEDQPRAASGNNGATASGNGASGNNGANATRRLFGRVTKEQLTGIISVRCGGRICDDLLINLGPGGMRLRAYRTLTAAHLLDGVTIYRHRQRKGSVQVPVRRVESLPWRDNGSEYPTHRAIFEKPLPSSICADLQAALSQGRAA